MSKQIRFVGGFPPVYAILMDAWSMQWISINFLVRLRRKQSVLIQQKHQNPAYMAQSSK